VGVFATRQFQKGDFLVQYCGEVITKDEGEKRDTRRSRNNAKHYYSFYYKFEDKVYW
jgi:SET domain-containing protein